MQEQSNKPPYKVPSMAEIAALPWNGFNVVSTFSGGGGSCLGYRMAGYRVLWANEFVPIAQESYKANHSNSYLDPRDIKTIQPAEILSQIGLQQGELDLFDGSPPCQAFSTAGKREKGWGKEKSYEHGAKQKNETLFDEYVRLLRGLMPKVFIAENVSGLVKGVAKGYFLQILKALKESGYQVEAKLLDAQWLGVPQQRQRIIFIGVRNDLNLSSAFPKPLSYRYSVRDAIPWIDGLAYTRGKVGAESKWKPHNKTFDVDREGCGNSPATCDSNFEVIAIEGANGFNSHAYQSANEPAATIQAGRPLNDIERPTIEPEMIIGNNAFKAQWGSLDNQSPTIMASGANEQGGFIRTAGNKRKFTIAELRRICAFPDDYILCGSYAQQWERLGNSVPPLMMKAIAEVIRDEILLKIKK